MSRGRKKNLEKRFEGMFHEGDEVECTSLQPRVAKKIRLMEVSPTAESAPIKVSLYGTSELNETILLTQLSQHIPTTFKHYRDKFAAEIINITFKAQYDETQVKHMLQEADSVSSLTKLICGKASQELLWNATNTLGTPINLFLAPPSDNCLECMQPLQINHDPVRVIIFTMDGPLLGLKITLRCKRCQLNYRYDKYGGEGGYRHYDSTREFVTASNLCYIQRELCEQWMAAGHHCWVSFEGSAEVYNELMRETCNCNYLRLKEYLEHNGEETCEEGQFVTGDLHRKSIANAFWNYQVELEMTEENERKYLFCSTSSREDYMDKVDARRANSFYPHKDCTKECLKRGCSSLWAIDGNWKLHYPVCMYQLPLQTQAFKGNLKYVNTCPQSPVHGMAFCQEHCDIMKNDGIPTELKKFNHFTKQGSSNQDQAASRLSSYPCAADCQGTKQGLSLYSDVATTIDSTDEVPETKTNCNKETGEKHTLQKWTRGTWFCVSGSGHIHTWQPLYKSEGPAQVFLLVIFWLVSEFGEKGRETWKKMTIAYDNMCHLNNLRVARQPLPLPGDLQYIWMDVYKVIDELHLKNHKDPLCSQIYNPESLKKDNPAINTMSCEQTFAWLSRHKKIICSMPKTHFHFYLHRLIKRRNKYISHCYKTGRRYTKALS